MSDGRKENDQKNEDVTENKQLSIFNVPFLIHRAAHEGLTPTTIPEDWNLRLDLELLYNRHNHTGIDHISRVDINVPFAGFLRDALTNAPMDICSSSTSGRCVVTSVSYSAGWNCSVHLLLG